MPRRRGPPLPSGDRDRRLAEEVLYLHNLWRRGPPAPIRSHSTRRKITKPDKRRRLECAAAAAEPQDTGSEWPLAPRPPSSSPRAWPEAASASSPSPAQPPPPPPPSPGSRAQREALRAAVEFFSSRDSDSDGSDSEGEEDAAGFFTGMFERDAALRGLYERGWEEGQFACMVCAAGKRKAGRRFRGCVALVQHARAAARYGRPRAHRALAAVVCRVLGWVFDRLPSIVIDPRGTLGQALASGARPDVQAAKENEDAREDNGCSSGEDEEKDDVETKTQSTHDDEDANELENSEESAGKDDVETGMEDSSTDGDEESNELAIYAEPAEREDVEIGMEGADAGKEGMEVDDSEKIGEKCMQHQKQF
ncbi:hypothetical protein U9M48_029714 [Paspalum notatum var. saurae]|uniref:Uncharacterized protein n=1 Tax=Paspalum notatum var. saurae TaxID=547442 RepID=A0AAQ3TYG6_PASNO